MDLKCPIVNCYDLDDQKHILQCQPLLDLYNKKELIHESHYEDIFSAQILKQKKLTRIFIDLIQIRTTILGQQDKT